MFNCYRIANSVTFNYAFYFFSAPVVAAFYGRSYVICGLLIYLCVRASERGEEGGRELIPISFLLLIMIMTMTWLPLFSVFFNHHAF